MNISAAFKKISLILFLGTIFLRISPLYAWNCHFLLTYAALKTSQVSKKPLVPAESLKDFVESEYRGLAKLLAANEKWSRKHLAYYPPLPSYLDFSNETNKATGSLRFLLAIRVNPTMKFPLFVQYPPGVKHRITSKPLSTEKVAVQEFVKTNLVYVPNPPLEEVVPGELLTPLEVLSSAADEPDYGMDINLWKNSNSWFGKIYNWGEQSFGNEKVVFGSQAPFHMGFFFESRLITHLASYLKRTYPEYRMHLYLKLSQFAFSRGHTYWGYRFLGWGLHYAQDLTQPYHVTLMPNVSILYLFSVEGLNLLGVKKPKQKLIQLLTNRHSSLENYEYFLLKNAFAAGKGNKFLAAAANSSNDSRYPPYSDNYAREVIAKEANQLAIRTEETIKANLPYEYVSDPNFIFYESQPVNLFRLNNNKKRKNALFHQTLQLLISHAASHTRNIVSFITQKKFASGKPG